MHNYPNINVYGNVGEGSGYRQAVKNIMECFKESKINCNLLPLGYYKNHKNFNSSSNIADIDFIISAPSYRINTNNYRIVYFYWETDNFPLSWKKELMKVDEIWCPCELVKECAIKMGFQGIIKVLPTPMRGVKRVALPINFKVYQDYVLDEKCFKFYSIFQWQFRKGYDLLLRGYLEEFDSSEDVVLIIKTNPLLQKDLKKDILNLTSKLKSKIKKGKYPKIIINDKFISNKDIDALHDMADCFVLPHRGEGWGMPISRAILFDNHIITTKYGGVTEYFDDSSANIINSTKIPVSNMEWCGLYSSNQNWAAPCLKSLKSEMRDVFSDEKNILEK